MIDGECAIVYFIPFAGKPIRDGYNKQFTGTQENYGDLNG